jgi:hypothetical protein
VAGLCEHGNETSDFILFEFSTILTHFMTHKVHYPFTCRVISTMVR